ncbi:MAG: FtsX-like permease family protein [Spirochaetota bacterium]
MIIRQIALRNVLRQKRRSLLLLAAIAFGAFAIILLTGITGGIEKNTRGNLTNLYGGHVYVRGVERMESGTFIQVIRDEEPLISAISASGIEVDSVLKRTSIRGSLIMGSFESSATIVGVDWEEERFLKDRLPLNSGSFEAGFAKNSIVIPEKLAAKLRVEVGDEILARMTTATNQNNVVDFVVAGIAKDTSDYADAYAYADLEYTAAALNLKPGEFQSLNIQLKNSSQANAAAALLHSAMSKTLAVTPRPSTQSPGVAADSSQVPSQGRPGPGGMGGGMGGGMSSLRSSLGAVAGVPGVPGSTPDGSVGKPTYSITTINDMMKTVDNLLSMLDAVGKGAFGILLVITMVGIGNTFRMMLMERTKEIGTMRALGMQRKEVLCVFLYEAIFLGLGGSLAGIVLAFIVGSISQAVPMGGVNSLFLLRGRLSFVVDYAMVATVVISLVALSLAAAFSPSRKASHLDPAAALRSAN